MPGTFVTLAPQDGERELVDGLLPDARWAVDGATGHECDAALVFWPREEMRRSGVSWHELTKLRILQVATAGVNHIGWRDIPEHVVVCNAPGSTKGPVAEYVLGAIVAWARGFQRFTREIAVGQWPLGASVRSLQSLRVGLVGYGGIGQAVACLLEPFGPKVRAVNRSGSNHGTDVQIDTMDALLDLAGWCDVLVVCVPLHQDTLGLIDADVLAQMAGRSSHIIHIARGPVVVEDDLFAWLRDNPSCHATVDVWWRYPKQEGERPFTRPFHELSNITMTPHNSPNVAGFRLDMIGQACENLLHWRATGTARNVQDREAHLLEVEGDGR